MKTTFDLTVIVPFYNEEKYLHESVSRLTEQKFIKEIILVNDASTDKSPEIARTMVKKDKRLNLINLNKNSGKGSAVKEALKKVVTSHVIVHDADLEYNPMDIFDMFNMLIKNSDSLILGSRTLRKRKSQNKYLITYLGNKYLTKLFSFLNNYKLSDIASCYWLIETDKLKKMNINEKGFGIEVEVLSKYIRNGGKVIEVPISYRGRTYADGKKIKIKDGLNILFKIIKFSKILN